MQNLFRLACAAVFAVFLTLSGCASTGSDGFMGTAELIRAFRLRGLDPRQIVMPYGISEEMALWAREAVKKDVAAENKLIALRDRLIADDDRPPIAYQWGYTGTAVEVFAERRANCLALMTACDSESDLSIGICRSWLASIALVMVEAVCPMRTAALA